MKELSGFSFANGRIFERVAFSDSIHDTVYVFAKKVIGGKLRLYLWRRNSWDNIDFFLINSTSGISVHLTPPVKVVVKDENGMQHTYEKISHVGLIRYVKNDTGNVIGREGNSGYSEHRILKNIYEYDKAYDKDYPVKIYRERKCFYDLTIGYPVFWATGGINFRAAFYFNGYRPEKNSIFSWMAGVSYRYWKSNKTAGNTPENDNLNYQQQWISAIPVGIQFRFGHKTVRPYFYTGIGMQVLLDGNYRYTRGDALGMKTELLFIPALNIGAGIKIRAGSNFIAIEITPAGIGEGIFANVGYSF